ncbi:MAG: mannose-1-phosphate guanylyltransferase [Flavobacteriia bacterium]|nr:mannose-1-phosphate guanylyltransferase [Flavobacteriia bacterium]
MKKNNYGLIMAGGIGSRFWPLSTSEKPKQFLDILGLGKSLLQMTFDRLSEIIPPENIYILTNSNYKDLVKTQLPSIDLEQIILEPQRKNTAPCIAYASMKIYSKNKDANLLIAPSDHLIVNDLAFNKNINLAFERALLGEIVTLGIKPSRPDTGYGYIEFDQKASSPYRKVIQFREKPNLEVAESFVQSGNFYWNAGIFIWKAQTIIDALKLYSPKLYSLFASIHYQSPNEKQEMENCFDQCQDISIDYAVMEQAKNVSIILADFDWSDLGTWGSVAEHIVGDNQNNATISGNVFSFNSSGNLVLLPKTKTAIVEGLNDYIIVDSEDKLLILTKKNEQELKKYLEKLNTKN